MISDGLRVADALDAARRACANHADELGRLDAVAGDGDHGLGMVRGMTAAADAARSTASGAAGPALVAAGDAFADAAGGASGALWGVFLRAIGTELGDGPVDRATLVAGLRKGIQRIERVGKAQVGDKTLLDALVPFVDALAAVTGSADAELGQAWQSAVEAGEAAASATAGLVARRGRSAVLGERSLGTVDPGARSFSLVAAAVGPYVTEAG